MAKIKKAKKPTCYAFIDAANLFYGGKKSLDWSVDYRKLLKYLKTKFGVREAFYYAGVELNNFPYDSLSARPINLDKVLQFHRKKIHILSRGERTAKEIRRLAGGKFIDFVRLRSKLEFEGK